MEDPAKRYLANQALFHWDLSRATTDAETSRAYDEHAYRFGLINKLELDEKERGEHGQ